MSAFQRERQYGWHYADPVGRSFIGLAFTEFSSALIKHKCYHQSQNSHLFFL